MASCTLAVDVGGTFTDATLADATTGRMWITKTPSTPHDLAVGFLTAIQKILALGGRGPADIVRVFHGTTTATNAILEGKTAPMGLLTTRGFKYVLEIGRHDIPREGNLYGWVKPTRPVTPDRILEVNERLDVSGQVLTALDEDDCRLAVRRLRQLGLPSIAVVFLHAYANPIHEQQAAKIIAQEYPEALVSMSSEVLPQFREFERSMATVLNAAVMPHVSRYLTGLRGMLDAQQIAAPLLIMKSNGGVTSAETAARQAIHTALSGPAAGVIGAVSVAHSVGFSNIISIDVGGTSADICLVRDRQPEITKDAKIGPFPLKIPIIDINTIGAGGGSVAAIMPPSRLEVGPRSAGADPGPVCYGRGGEEPTVTDANLLLGRIPPALLGGEIELDRAAARQAIQQRIARPLGLSLDEAAAGVVEIINNHMARAIRTVSIGRGHDPRQFALVAFGGAGPLHACRLAELLDIPAIVIPPTPGVLSTYGLLSTDLKNDYVQTCYQEGPQIELARVTAGYADLEALALEWLRSEQVPTAAQRLVRSADLRYAHQSFELTCPMPAGQLTQASVQHLVEAFHHEHRRLYTYDLPHAPVELVNLRVTAIGLLPRVKSQDAGVSALDLHSAVAEVRPVYFDQLGGFAETPCYVRQRLGPGMTFDGPAIVDQADATTLVYPNFRVRVDAVRNLILERRSL
ncbi:MAG TPA: hydantoinase/oxoprolinase family protein [Candidatus Tectomicrobia bacterium]|nr:hydantoinase/oxoprolinase family protein [Candidatus Tectomicrobia bacterium]